MDFPAGEFVTVARGGVIVASVRAAIDPHEHKLYLPYDADVQLGDIVSWTGHSYRITGGPERWRSPFGDGWEAGSVVLYGEGARTLPDVGVLLRRSGTVFDRTLNTEVPTWQQMWTGPCLVDPPTSEGSEAEAGQQRITIQPFTVTVPLSVVDIRPDDQFKITTSADPRLVNRVLQVTRVKAASLAVERQFTAIDNQG